MDVFGNARVICLVSWYTNCICNDIREQLTSCTICLTSCVSGRMLNRHILSDERGFQPEDIRLDSFNLQLVSLGLVQSEHTRLRRKKSVSAQEAGSRKQ